MCQMCQPFRRLILVVKAFFAYSASAPSELASTRTASAGGVNSSLAKRPWRWWCLPWKRTGAELVQLIKKIHHHLIWNQSLIRDLLLAFHQFLLDGWPFLQLVTWDASRPQQARVTWGWVRGTPPHRTPISRLAYRIAWIGPGIKQIVS